MTAQVMEERDTFIFEPTLLARLAPGERIQLVSVRPDCETEALLVFRTPEELAKFQEDLGKYTAEEGFKAVGMDHEEIAEVLDWMGFSGVAMPQAWDGGEGGVDFFTAENFVRLLESRRLDESAEERGRVA